MELQELQPPQIQSIASLNPIRSRLGRIQLQSKSVRSNESTVIMLGKEQNSTSIHSYPDIVSRDSPTTSLQQYSSTPVVKDSIGGYIYICGSLNHWSISATATEAARHGFRISLIQDCLGFNNPLLQLDPIKTILNASDTNSQNIIAESSGQGLVERIEDLISALEITRSRLGPSSLPGRIQMDT